MTEKVPIVCPNYNENTVHGLDFNRNAACRIWKKCTREGVCELFWGLVMDSAVLEKGVVIAKFVLSLEPGILAVEQEELINLRSVLRELFDNPRYHVLGNFDGEQWDLESGHCTFIFHGEVDRIERVLRGLIMESPFVGRVTILKHYGEDRENASKSIL